MINFILKGNIFINKLSRNRGCAQLVEALRYTRKVSGSISVGVIRIFRRFNPRGRPSL